MEQRIQQIVSRFSLLRSEQSLNTNSDSKNVLKENPEEIKKEVVKEVVKKPAVYQKPLMMKKINQYRHELAKNNLKKQQQAFVFHGNIDDYEKELDKRSSIPNKID
jgi:hypothetical protein